MGVSAIIRFETIYRQVQERGAVAPGGSGQLWWKVSKTTLASPPPVVPAALSAPAGVIMPLQA